MAQDGTGGRDASGTAGTAGTAGASGPAGPAASAELRPDWDPVAPDPGAVVDPAVAPGPPGGTEPPSGTEPERSADPLVAEELSLDPRAIARASLAAGRNSSLWWVTVGVGVAIAVAVLVSTAAGALTLAGLLAVGAVVRAASPPPGPAALVARGRPLDVLMLFSLAFALAILSQVIPTR